MLTTPSLKMPIRPFDATKDYEFIFYVNGGNQVLRSNLIIEDMETNVEIYNDVQESFSYKHNVPANTLINGKSYKVKIRTGGSENKWSQFSDFEMFYCFSPATVTDITIDRANQNRVYNQTIDFEATYGQAQLEELQSYRFLLFDSNKDLIKSFSEQFYSGEGNLVQQITGLSNGELYYIQIKTESVNGLLSDTDLLWFRPFYITPRLSAVVTPTNLKEQGAIKLSSNIIQIIGKLYDDKNVEIPPSDVEYMGGEWLDLTRPDYKKLTFDKGFEVMQSDFALKMWCKNIPDDEVFLTLHSNRGIIDLLKRDNRIHAYKTLVNFKHKVHIASELFDFDTKLEYMIGIKQINSMLDIVVEEVAENDIGI